MAIRSTSVSIELDLLMNSTWTLSYNHSGCYYSNQYQPAIYGYSRINQIPVQVRYYKDSFISADELTEGCSSTLSSFSSCFGISRKHQDIIGIVLIVIGALMALIEIVVVVIDMCCCC